MVSIRLILSYAGSRYSVPKRLDKVNWLGLPAREACEFFGVMLALVFIFNYRVRQNDVCMKRVAFIWERGSDDPPPTCRRSASHYHSPPIERPLTCGSPFLRNYNEISRFAY